MPECFVQLNVATLYSQPFVRVTIWHTANLFVDNGRMKDAYYSSTFCMHKNETNNLDTGMKTLIGRPQRTYYNLSAVPSLSDVTRAKVKAKTIGLK
jgi:hypothetical protein